MVLFIIPKKQAEPILESLKLTFRSNLQDNTFETLPREKLLVTVGLISSLSVRT